MTGKNGRVDGAIAQATLIEFLRISIINKMRKLTFLNLTERTLMFKGRCATLVCFTTSKGSVENITYINDITCSKCKVWLYSLTLLNTCKLLITSPFRVQPRSNWMHNCLSSICSFEHLKLVFRLSIYFIVFVFLCQLFKMK